MKISSKAHSSIRGRHKEAIVVEQSIKGLLNKYGFELTRYVSNRLLEKETAKRKLEREIATREKELSKLKAKR